MPIESRCPFCKEHFVGHIMEGYCPLTGLRQAFGICTKCQAQGPPVAIDGLGRKEAYRYAKNNWYFRE